MIFPLNIPCPYAGKHLYQCERLLPYQVEIKFGEHLKFLARGCGHISREDIANVLEDHYCDVANWRGGSIFKMTAWNYGQCDRYYWRLCCNCQIREAESGAFCSGTCASEYDRKVILRMRGSVCSVCGGVFEKPYWMTRRLPRVSNKLIENGHFKICSAKCCSLALTAILNSEREQRKTLKEIRCVQEVRKVLSKTRKELRRNRCPEVLRSLKEEFEQAGNSPR